MSKVTLPEYEEVLKEREGNKMLKDTDNSTVYLVVDLGSYLIKYSVFVVYDESRTYLLNMELKDSKDIVLEGLLNQNLLQRDLERKIETFNKFGNEMKVIVIVPKPFISDASLPHMEIKTSEKDELKEIKDYIKTLSSADLLSDWAKLYESPADDKYSLYLEGVNYDFVIQVVQSLINLKIKDYSILSPMQALANSVKRDPKEVSLLVDMGHTMTSAVIVQGSRILSSKVISMGSKQLNDKLNPVMLEAIKIKHNSSIQEYNSEVYQALETLAKEVRGFVDTYEKNSLEKVECVRIIGGPANSDVENLFNLDSFKIPIKPIELDLENESLIPREPRNYLTLSYGALMTSVLAEEYDAFDKIDYSEPKDSGLMKMKKLLKWYNNNKKYAYSLTAAMLITIGNLSLGAMQISEKVSAYDASLAEVQGKLGGYQAELTSLGEQYQTTLSSVNSSGAEQYNIGDLMYRISASTPPNLNIKSLQLNSNSETGIIVIKTDDERLASMFITLIQDPQGEMFNKANVGSVDITEVNGIKYYENKIFVEGFNF